MTDTLEIAHVYQQALLGDSEALTQLGDYLADDVAQRSPLGRHDGKASVLAGLAESRLRAMLADGEWDEPVTDNGNVVLRVTAAAGGFAGGWIFTLAPDASGRIARIEEDRLPAAKGTPGPIVLTDDLRELINGAPLNGLPILVAYITAAGQPRISYRGTVQTFGSSGNQLALWLRDPEGGMASAIRVNEKISLFYVDRAKGSMLEFLGRAWITTDDAERTAVFEGSVEMEQNIDWRRKGVAVIVDLDSVEGRAAGAPVSMAASPAD
jgi:hypothetical protein